MRSYNSEHQHQSITVLYHVANVPEEQQQQQQNGSAFSSNRRPLLFNAFVIPWEGDYGVTLSSIKKYCPSPIMKYNTNFQSDAHAADSSGGYYWRVRDSPDIPPPSSTTTQSNISRNVGNLISSTSSRINGGGGGGGGGSGNRTTGGDTNNRNGRKTTNSSSSGGAAGGTTNDAAYGSSNMNYWWRDIKNDHDPLPLKEVTQSELSYMMISTSNTDDSAESITSTVTNSSSSSSNSSLKQSKYRRQRSTTSSHANSNSTSLGNKPKSPGRSISTSSNNGTTTKPTTPQRSSVARTFISKVQQQANKPKTPTRGGTSRNAMARTVVSKVQQRGGGGGGDGERVLVIILKAIDMNLIRQQQQQKPKQQTTFHKIQKLPYVKRIEKMKKAGSSQLYDERLMFLPSNVIEEYNMQRSHSQRCRPESRSMNEIDYKLKHWCTNSQTKKRVTLQVLLSTLQNVLWDNSGWNIVTLEELNHPKRCVICYRKALRILFRKKNGTSVDCDDSVYLSDCIFDILRQAKDDYDATLLI